MDPTLSIVWRWVAMYNTLSEKNYETLCFCKVTELSCIYKGIQLITTKYKERMSACDDCGGQRKSSKWLVDPLLYIYLSWRRASNFSFWFPPPKSLMVVPQVETDYIIGPWNLLEMLHNWKRKKDTRWIHIFNLENEYNLFLSWHYYFSKNWKKYLNWPYLITLYPSCTQDSNLWVEGKL